MVWGVEATQAILCFGPPNCHLLFYPLFPCSKYKPLLFQSLVVKPDQLIKRRGKLGLVGVNLTLDGVKSWLKPRLGQEATVSLGVGLGCRAVVASRSATPWFTAHWSGCGLGEVGVLRGWQIQRGQPGCSLPAPPVREQPDVLHKEPRDDTRARRKWSASLLAI